jgi:hypothetical protein
MSTRDDLIAAIRQALGPTFAPPSPPSGSSPQARRARRTQDAHLYEQYLWTLALEAARREDAVVDFWDVFGNRITSAASLVFRAGPGMIYSTRRPYVHARLLFPNLPPLEAHIDIKVAGSSDVVHECDVLILSQAEAETCRRQRVLPHASKVILGIEGKLHGAEIPLREGRSFIGLTSEFQSAHLYFVSNISSPSVRKLLTAKSKRWEHNIAPTPPSFTTDEERLINAFQKTFVNAAVKRE